jgi:hypothetical protein
MMQNEEGTHQYDPDSDSDYFLKILASLGDKSEFHQSGDLQYCFVSKSLELGFNKNMDIILI